MPSKSKCKCGKNYASNVDNVCRYCREDEFSRAEGKRVGVNYRGAGMDLEQKAKIIKSKQAPASLNYLKKRVGKITIGRVASPTPNKHSYRVDRVSVLGNPFKMFDEASRDLVCDKYDDYFPKEVAKKGRLRDTLMELFQMVKSGKDVELLCHCAPKRCHADTIKAFMESHL